MQKKSEAFPLFALLFITLALIFYALSYERGTLVVQYYSAPVALLFCGYTLRRYRKPCVYWLGAAFIGWFILSRILAGELYLENSYWHLAGLLVTYALAFPFAYATEDAQRRKGIIMVAVVLSVSFTLFALLSIIGILTGQNIVLPWLNSEFGIHNAKLYANQHSNGSAILFLIGMLFTFFWMFKLRRRQLIAPGVMMCLICYAGIALTVSRTVMIECSLALGTLAGLAVWRSGIRSGKLRFAAALTVGLVFLLLSYMGYHAIARIPTLLTSHAAAQTVQQAEKTTQLVIAKRPLLDSLGTLSGRTQIYAAIIPMFRDHPQALLITGFLNSELVGVLHQYIPAEHVHMHNAWLQTLVNMGVPGLLLALCFTWLAVRSGLRTLLFWGKRTTADDKVLALMVLLLLVNSMFECVIFTETFNIGNVTFFLTLGYLLELERRLKVQNGSDPSEQPAAMPEKNPT